jgi:predicted RNA-binding protein YlxR (DUF448 family)
MGRGGAKSARASEPERKCIATGDVEPKAGLIRFVVGPDNQVVPDIAGKLPGRGIYVSATPQALDKAASKGLFARAAKQAVTVPEGLVADIERQLTRRVIELLSLARKSGKAVAGYEKVKDFLYRDDAKVLMQASDGSERGKTKLSTPHFGHYIGWLTADELGQAFGRSTVIHGALASGGLTQRVVEEANRLRRMREKDAGARVRRKG